MSDLRTTGETQQGLLLFISKKRRKKIHKLLVHPLYDLSYLSLMSDNNMAFAAANSHIKVLSFLLWSYSLQSRGGKVSSCIVIRGLGFGILMHTAFSQLRLSQISDCEMSMTLHLIRLIWYSSLSSGPQCLHNPHLHLFIGWYVCMFNKLFHQYLPFGLFFSSPADSLFVLMTLFI